MKPQPTPDVSGGHAVSAAPAPVRSPAAAAHQLDLATTPREGFRVWLRFRRHRLALLGAVLLIILASLALFAPWVAGQDPYSVDLKAYRKPPTAQHLLGTDSSGRDVFSRLLHGARISLSVGVVAVLVYTVLGVGFGAIAGLYGGLVDSTIMRLADVVMAFPALILIITVASVVGPSIYNVMLVIGILGWPPIARIVRGMILSLREQEFMLSARAVGVGNARLIRRHLLPNVVAPVIVAASYGMASAILIEAGLSFLGLGVQPPTASWGNMLNAAQSISILETMPWLWVPPGLMIAVTVLSLNFIGDGLRDALDPFQTL